MPKPRKYPRDIIATRDGEERMVNIWQAAQLGEGWRFERSAEDPIFWFRRRLVRIIKIEVVIAIVIVIEEAMRYWLTK